jgi:uncharacterized protein YjaG (DUF416 family)
MNYEYRNADPYRREMRTMVEAADDAADLRSQVPALKAYIALLEALVKQVKTAVAEHAISEAIGSIEDAIASLEVGANRVADECED